MKDLDRKEVLITGAAGSIGQEICRYFCSCGAKVLALDSHQEETQKLRESIEKSEPNPTISSVIVDATQSEQLQARLTPLLKDKGCDILIHTIGATQGESFQDLDSESWTHEVNLNLNVAYHCVNLVLPYMKKKGGSIVIIGSVNGLAFYGNPAYSAAKAGLSSLAKSLAVEYGRYNIRANLVCPGSVRTNAWQHRIEKNPQIFQELLKWYPLNRITLPLEVAKTCAFLASENASAISGVTLPVDCGLSAGNGPMAQTITQRKY